MSLLRSFGITLLGLCAGASAQTLTFVHANVIDVETGKLRPDTTVVIDGKRITAVRRSGRSDVGTGEIVDARGKYLIPGLWDMHTHVYFGRTAADGTDLILPLFIANGITGIRDMGSDLDMVLQAREDVAAHRIQGPRMVVSGPMIDGPKTKYKAGIPVATPDEGRKSVDLLKSRGVDFIKVQSGIPRDAYFAIVEQTKKDGIEFEGHVPDSIRASEAVASGQRTFEHLIGIFEASSPDETRYLTLPDKKVGMFLDTYDPKLEAGIIRLLAKRKVWQCPTLFWERGQWLVDDIDYNADPDLAYAGHSWVTRWSGTRKSLLQTLDTDSLPIRRKFVAHELEIVRKLHAAGVPFLAGTDTPAGVDLVPGVSLHLELQRFVDAGFTPLQALRTATLSPARFFNRTADFGTVQAGRMADLVLLDANPLDDIANTRRISGVVADGRYYSAEELTQLRARLKELAATK